ncbi:MAG: type II toxin-antitoxin system HicB family antitoxin [Candidatus Eremiobacteraeota bacterium]|nr:type II toxin-antitoxin system HicB family antitoxin [Candidatus Eremiobacteraeota bacterium]
MTYQAELEQDEDGSVFAYVPDLPGCISWGATFDEARENVREAMALWISVTRERGGRLADTVDDIVRSD